MAEAAGVSPVLLGQVQAALLAALQNDTASISGELVQACMQKSGLRLCELVLLALSFCPSQDAPTTPTARPPPPSLQPCAACRSTWSGWAASTERRQQPAALRSAAPPSAATCWACCARCCVMKSSSTTGPQVGSVPCMLCMLWSC